MRNYRFSWVQNLSNLFSVTFCSGSKNYDLVMSAHSLQKLLCVGSQIKFSDFSVVLSDFEVVLIELAGMDWIGCENESIIEVNKKSFFAVIGRFSDQIYFLYEGVMGFGVLDCKLVPLRMVNHILDETEFGMGIGFMGFFGSDLLNEIADKITRLGISLKLAILL